MGRGVGLSVRSGWMMGKGQNLRSGYIFIYVKQAEFLLKSIYSTRLLFFFTLTRIEIVKKKLYLLPNPGLEMPKTFWVRGHT